MERKLKLGDVWKYETDRLFTQENRVANYARHCNNMV